MLMFLCLSRCGKFITALGIFVIASRYNIIALTLLLTKNSIMDNVTLLLKPFYPLTSALILHLHLIRPAVETS